MEVYFGKVARRCASASAAEWVVSRENCTEVPQRIRRSASDVERRRAVADSASSRSGPANPLAWQQITNHWHGRARAAVRACLHDVHKLTLIPLAAQLQDNGTRIS